jgi:DUF4097 and DUF4098 domain-containing protein YvlB
MTGRRRPRQDALVAERVRVTVNSGDVVVIGEPRDGIDVDGGRTEAAAGEIVVKGGSDDCTVRVPSGTDVVVGSNSGDVTLEGLLGAVSVTTVSASVAAEDVGSIDARTISGRLEVEESRGPVRLKTKSAPVHVGRAAGDVRVASLSGRVEVEEAQGSVSVKTVSAPVELHATGRAPVRAETVSGTITITVPTGTRPAVRQKSLSGKRRVDVAAGTDLEITTKSVSGSTTIRER